MEIKEWFSNKHTEYEKDLEYQFYYYQTLIVEKILEYLEENDLSKQEFAIKLDVSPAYVSKILNGGNFTLRKLIDIAIKLDLDFELIMKKKFNPGSIKVYPKQYSEFNSKKESLSNLNINNTSNFKIHETKEYDFIKE